MRPAGRRRANWYVDYVDAVVQRDVRDLSRISAFDVLPQMLRLAAGQTSKLFNLSELGAPFRQTLPTITDYFGLLERVFLVQRLRPWHSNRLSRLVKTPKLHVSDTGVACALLGTDATALRADRQLLGQLLEKDDFRGLRKLQRSEPDRFVAGVVLYDGEICASFGEGLFAVPVRFLWESVRVDRLA